MAALDIAPYFMDIDGDNLVFSSDNLPEGLIISRAGVISGTASQFGSFAVKIYANDGINSLVAYVDFSIENNASVNVEIKENSSGGAMVYVLLLLMMVSRRRCQ